MGFLGRNMKITRRLEVTLVMNSSLSMIRRETAVILVLERGMSISPHLLYREVGIGFGMLGRVRHERNGRKRET
jgi:hypothetical protein